MKSRADLVLKALLYRSEPAKMAALQKFLPPSRMSAIEKLPILAEEIAINDFYHDDSLVTFFFGWLCLQAVLKQ